MKYPLGTWKGVESTITGFPVANDVVTFCLDGTVRYSTTGPKGEQWNFRYETEEASGAFLLYPLSDAGILQTEAPSTILIEYLSTETICIKRGGHSTIYKRNEE